MSLKKKMMDRGMKMMQDPRVMKAMQDPRVMKAMTTAFQMRGKVQQRVDERKEQIATSFDFATKKEVRELKRSIRKLERELKKAKQAAEKAVAAAAAS